MPAASEDVAIAKGAGLMINDNALVADIVPLSVTRTVKLLVPAVPGVPDIVPPAARVSPDGSVPLATDHVYGGVPPVATRACE